MAHDGKELEAQLVEVGNRLATPPSDVDELLSLLDQTENFLSRVKQLPSVSMSTALYPAMNALTSKELLNHSEKNVKVYVASCMSEITRITAPEIPYNDNLMKEIFQVIVDVFRNFNDLSFPSFSKGVSVLETVANVRSCVVMLDLECDDLILEMFQHFLKAIRASHTGNIFSSMVTIMTLVLQESEDISSELLSCLLATVKKTSTVVLPTERRLGEKVIGNSAAKLKPHFVKLVQSKRISLSDYSNVVASICQKNSDASYFTELNSSEYYLADECKLSRRTISRELPQGSTNLEQKVDCSGMIGAITDKPPMLVLGNGTALIKNDYSIGGTNSPKQKSECYCDNDQSNNTVVTVESEPNKMDVKPDGKADYGTKKRIRRKSNLSIQGNDAVTLKNGSSSGGINSSTQKPAYYCGNDQSKSAIVPFVAEPNEVDYLSAVKPDIKADYVSKKRVGSRSNLSIRSNITVSIKNVDSIGGPSSPKQKPVCYRGNDRPGSAIAAAIAEPTEVDYSADLKPDHKANNITEGRIGRKSILSVETSFSKPKPNKAAPAVPSRRSRRKEADILRGEGAEASVSLQPEEKAELASSPTGSGNISDAIQPTMIQPFGSKVTANEGGVNADSDPPASTCQKTVSENYLTEDETLPSDINESKKENIYNCDTVGKTLARSGKMARKKNSSNAEIPSPSVIPKKKVDGTIDYEAKDLRKRSIKVSARSGIDREPSLLQNSKSNQQKGRIGVVRVEAEELTLKDMISSRKSWKALNRDQYHFKESRIFKSERKCALGTLEVAEAQNHGKELNESIVGSKIKVWWPDDKMFYDGVVDSFDPLSKKHKILYFDGDIEVLLLKNERFQLIEDVCKTEGGHAKDKTSAIISREIEVRPSRQSRVDGTRSSGNSNLSERPMTRYLSRSTCIDGASEASRRSMEKDGRKYDIIETSSYGNSDEDIIKLRFRNFIRKTGSISEETLKSRWKLRGASTMKSETDRNALTSKRNLKRQESEVSAKREEIRSNRSTRRKIEG